MEVLDGVLLPRHLRAGSVDEDAVLVDHVHDGRDLALAGAVLQHSHGADRDELLERLQEKDKWWQLILTHFNDVALRLQGQIGFIINKNLLIFWGEHELQK